MGFPDRRTVSVLSTVLVFLGVIALLWEARRPVTTFIFAIFFAHLLEPVVGRFETWLRLSRGKAVAVTYGAILLGFVIFGLTVGPRILQQGRRLQETLPESLENIRSGNIALQLGNKQGWSYSTQTRLQQWLVEHRDDIARYATDVKNHSEQIAANVAWILLVPVLAIFVLKDRSKLGHSALDLISASSTRAFLESVITDLDTMLAAYVRAQLLLAFFAFIAYGAFLLIARMPYALAIAAIAGILEFIPIAGPLFALGILVGIALLTGYSHWGLLVGFWLIWRGVQDYVNAPRVMAAGLDLHPLLTIFAILVGGEMAGIVGIFLSVPAVAALRILWLNWTRRPPMRQAA
jgi:predicted PurR-regulated permease PerM